MKVKTEEGVTRKRKDCGDCTSFLREKDSASGAKKAIIERLRFVFISEG